MKELLKNKNFVVGTTMLFGTLIYCFGVVYILDLGGFYAGGVTGISQILHKLFGPLSKIFSISFFIALINIPLFIVGFQGVSKRFAIVSVASIIIQVIAISFFEHIRFKFGFDPFAASFGDDKLILAVFGGLICGIGIGISLRFGASTGGMDIVSQYLSFKKNIAFTKISMTIDIIIVILGWILAKDIAIAIYTVTRLIVQMSVVERIHTTYNFLKIKIITTELEELQHLLISRFNHGLTIYEVIGGYSNKKRWAIETVVSSFEANDYRNAVKEIDHNAFITFTAIKTIEGNFNKNVVA